MYEAIVQVLDDVLQIRLAILLVLLLAHGEPTKMQIPIDCAPV